MADHQKTPSLFCSQSGEIEKPESINDEQSKDVENLGIIMTELFGGNIRESLAISIIEAYHEWKSSTSTFFLLSEIVPQDELNTKDREIVYELMMSCRIVDQSSRPTASTLRKLVRMTSFSKRNIVELIVQRLQVQATTLENVVSLRTEQLVEERKKVDELLHEMLPR
jgi:hypothetical protein